MGKLVNVSQGGKTFAIDESQLAEARSQGFHVEGDDEAASRIQKTLTEERFGGTTGAVLAGGLGLSRTVTGGLSDAALRMVGGEGAAQDLESIREAHPYISLGSEVAGAFVDPLGATSIGTRLGARAARGLEEGGTIAQIAGAGVKAGTEGAVLGAQQGISELAMSQDPVTFERAASVIGSNALFGAGVGGVIGGVGKAAEKGLQRAKVALDKYAEKGLNTAADVGEDLAGLDRKGLRAAEKAELDAVEAARVPRRAELADEIKTFRQELKQNKLWLATKDSEDAEVRAIGKRTFKADRQLDNLLDDPKALAESPKSTMSALRKQEAALDELVNKHGEKLRTAFASDTSGARAAALDYASTALEKNRALQAKIAEVSGKPASTRLEAIQDALAGLGTATKKESATIGDMLGASALGHAVGALAGVPYLGQAVLAAKAVGGLVKKLGGDTAAAAARGSQAIQTFLDAGAKVAPRARTVATKTLTSVSYAAVTPEKPSNKRAAAPALADVYKARSSEIRDLTAPGPDGKPVMRMDARAKMAERLAPIRAAHPVLADRIESNKALGIEYLARTQPKMPDLPGMDRERWQPSDIQMREWARRVAGVEDPLGIVERLASGEVTPEDAETMREVYPEMYAQIQAEIMTQMGELRAKLPYARRLALSIFSGVPVDPCLDPRVLAVLQGSFAAELGTEGGVQAPRAEPAFGSVTKPEPTPAQQRSAG